MSISIKDFEKGNFGHKNTPAEEDYVLEFLKKHKGRAFKIKEIAKEVKRSESTIACNTRRLLKQKKIRRKTPYYTI